MKINSKKLKKVLSVSLILGICISIVTPYATFPKASKAYAEPSANVAGIFQGKYSVNQFGAANYQIPIEIPKGINGAQPQIGLTYNSLSGNDIMGPGWTLNGLSEIGRKFGKDSLQEDQYVFDGDKLIPTRSSGDGIEYHPEKDPWTKIISHSSNGIKGTSWFEVFTKDGKTLEFGNTADSKVMADTGYFESVRNWLINKMTDRNGNYIKYSYLNNGQGQYYPYEIAYTGNLDGLSPQMKVVFEYENRADIDTKYMNSSKVIINERLKTIKTFVQNNLARRYELVYQQDSSKLSAVTQYDRFGNSMKPIKFEWESSNTAQNNWTVTSLYGGPVGHEPVYADGDPSDVYPVIEGDWDGDGKTELAWIRKDRIEFRIHNDQGTEEFVNIYDLCQDKGFSDVNKNPILIGDWNGDGKTDIARVGDSSVSFYVSTGKGFKSYPKLGNFSPSQGFSDNNKYPVITGDWNGDGTTDIARVGDDRIYFYLMGDGGTKGYFELNNFARSQGYSNNDKYPIITGDWNGDGKTDLGRVSNDKTFFVLSTGNGFVSYPEIGKFGAEAGYTNYTTYPIITGDWNGDGKTDVARVAYTRVHFCVSTGKGFENLPYLKDWGVTEGYSDCYNYPIVTGDWNGDGKTDIARKTPKGDISLLVSDKDFWKNYYTIKADSKFSMEQRPLISGDWDGSGKSSIMTYMDYNDSQIKIPAPMNYISQNINPGDRINKITDSIGQCYSISYKPLGKAHYKEDNSYSYADNVIPMCENLTVVDSYTINTANTNYGLKDITYNYSYVNSRYDKDEKKFLGFASVCINNNMDKTEERTNYAQNIPYEGSVLNDSKGIRNADGNFYLLSNTDYSYKSLMLLIGGEYLNEIVKDKVSSKNYNLKFDSSGNVIAQQEMNTETKTYNYDKFGNMITELDNDGAGGQVYTQNAYYDNDSAYCYGMLTDTKITTSPAKDFSKWNPSSDLSWERIIYQTDSQGKYTNVIANSKWDDSSNKWFKKTYTYDDYGNITNETDPKGRTTHYKYDSTFNTFLLQKQSPKLGAAQQFLETYEYDLFSGQITKDIDINGNAIEYGIDGFGRQTEVRTTNPNGKMKVLKKYNILNGEGDKGIILETKKRNSWDDADDNQDNWYWERDYKDAFSYSYKSEKLGPDNKVIVACKKFSYGGQVTYEETPHFQGETIFKKTYYNYNPAGVVNQINVDHDVAATINVDWNANTNREVVETTTFPEGSAYDHRTTSQEIDVHGDTVKTVFAKKGAETTFDYDLLGRCIRAEDADNSMNKTIYNSLGDKLETNSIDTGRVTFTYDNSLLKTKTYANGKKEEYTYDAMARVLTMTIPGESTTIYTYDQGANGKGRLSSVEKRLANNITESKYEYSYDKYGNCIKTIITIDGKSYIFTAEFGPGGEITKYTYPDNSLLTYTYDRSGRVTSIDMQDATNQVRAQSKNLAKFSNYTALDQPGNILYGNGVTTSYNYGADGTLKNSQIKNASGTLLSNLAYSWDKYNNITSIQDLDKSGLDESQTFTYDSLDHLISAIGVYGSKQYSYTDSGLLISNKDLTKNTEMKNINQSEAHAVRKQYLNGAVFSALTYDSNGNLTQKQYVNSNTINYNYDGQNQLINVSSGNTSSDYKYDYNGNIIKTIEKDSNGINTTKYTLMKTYAITTQQDAKRASNTTHTKYIFGADGCIASISKNSSEVRLLTKTNYSSLYSNSNSSLQNINQWMNKNLTTKNMFNFMMLTAGLFLMFAAFEISKKKDYKVRNSATSKIIKYVSAILVAAMFIGIIPSNFAMAQGISISPNPGVTGTYYYSQDNVGSTNIATDINGNVVYKAIHDPYGTLDKEHSIGLDKFTDDFTGQDFKNGSKLYYFQSRFYDPELCTFITADSELGANALQYVSAFNRYAYAGGNPIKYIDPSGHNFIDSLKMACAILCTFGAFIAGIALAFAPIPGMQLLSELLVGGLVSAGISGFAYGMDIFINQKEFNFGSWVANFGFGFLAGIAGAGLNAGLGAVFNKCAWLNNIPEQIFKNAFRDVAKGITYTISQAAVQSTISVLATVTVNGIEGNPLGDNLGLSAILGAAGGAFAGVLKGFQKAPFLRGVFGQERLGIVEGILESLGWIGVGVGTTIANHYDNQADNPESSLAYSFSTKKLNFQNIQTFEGPSFGILDGFTSTLQDYLIAADKGFRNVALNAQ